MKNSSSLDSPLFPSNGEGYQFIWDETSEILGDLTGDDILKYGSSFGPFHNNSELESKIFSLELNFPDIFEVFKIGNTYFNRSVYGVKVTDETMLSKKSQILFVAQQHAREQIARESALYFLDFIANKSLESTNEIWEILKEKEIFVIPSLNLDGASILHQFPWMRKTLPKINQDSTGFVDGYNESISLIEPRDINADGYIDEYYDVVGPEEYLLHGYEGIDVNGDGFVGDNIMGGIDPNRNFDYDFANPNFTSGDPFSQAYHGGTPFSENIANSLNIFVNEHEFEIIIDLHSGIRTIYLPNLGEANKGKEHDSQFQIITQGIYKLTKIPYQESFYSGGMFIPWVYNTQSDISYAATYEVYGNKNALVEIENGNPSLLQQRGIWDMFNPPANQIIPVCEEVAVVLEYLVGVNLIIERKIPGYEFFTLIFLIGTIFVNWSQFKRKRIHIQPKMNYID